MEGRQTLTWDVCINACATAHMRAPSHAYLFYMLGNIVHTISKREEERQRENKYEKEIC